MSLRLGFGGCSAFATLALGPLIAAEPPLVPKDERRYVITEHGALGDGITLNTRAIQTAIDRCAMDGGGAVVVPKGIFLSGSIFLKQGVKLLVEKDGVLRGSVDPGSFPQIPTRWEGVEREWTAALVNAIDLDGRRDLPARERSMARVRSGGSATHGSERKRRPPMRRPSPIRLAEASRA